MSSLMSPSSVNKSNVAYIGADVGGTNIRMAAVNSTGQLLAELRAPTPAKDGPEKVLTLLSDLYHRIIENVKIQNLQYIPALGVGWPGPVDRQAGRVYETHNITGFENYEFSKNLEKLIQAPVYLDNDAKCASLAEKEFGAGQQLKNFVYLTFGTGIGGVVYNNGEIVYGKNGLAGEIGHMTLFPKGENCTCGSQGCFERYCSAIALERRFNTATGEKLSAREILTAAEKENSIANVVLRDFMDDLAIGIGSLITILNPEAIIFSGGLFKTGSGQILGIISEKLGRQGFQSMKKKVKLVSSQLQGQAGMMGAAAIAIKNFNVKTATGPDYSR